MTIGRKVFHNIPNTLSVYRIIAAPGLLLLIIMDESTLFTWLLLISLISDILDGMIARAFQLQSMLGARLDSIGDMSTFVVAIIGILTFQMAFVREQIVGSCLVLGFYLLQTVVALVKYHKITSFHTILAKINACFQSFFIMTLFIFGFQGWIFYPMVVVSVITYFEEILLVLLLKEPKSNVGGLWRVLRKGKAT